MELEWNHVYHPAPFPLTDIQAVFTEGITCILGDDLEGKQLLFQFTTAVRAPMQGQVRFLGYDTAMLGNAYTDHISYAGQYPFYPPEITLYQYLIHTSLTQRLSAREAACKSEELLWESGYPELRSVPIGELPLSARRHIQLLQTLCSEAPVLILNEPFTNLDPGARKQMDTLLADHMDEKIILVFTQKEDPFPDLPCQFHTLHKGRLTSWRRKNTAQPPYHLLLAQ